METITLADLARRAFEVTLIISFPFLIVSLVVGLVISLLQALTNIQEATLSFVPKIIAVFLTLFILGAFVKSSIVDLTKELLEGIPKLLGVV